MNKFDQFKKCALQSKKIVGIIGVILCFALPHWTFASQTNRDDRILIASLQQRYITLTIKNKPIRFILNEIKKQSGYGFIFEDPKGEKELDNLSLTVEKRTLEQALTQLLKNTQFTFRIQDNIIIIQKRSAEKRTRLESHTPARWTIRGKVVDQEDRVQMPGVTVIVKGTTTGTVTDSDGRYEIEATPGATLCYSFIGKATQEIVVKSGNPIDVILSNDIMELNDVVVTGYADINRKNYTGNAVTIRRDELLKVSKTNIMKGIQAFDPSFRIKDNNLFGSDPNHLPEMNIRGASSIGDKQIANDGSYDPLAKSNLRNNPNLPTFIMDGFEISASKLYDFDPNRIESITILKDAAATALYGSRAANGVVVITTVKPRSGKLNVSYNFVGDLSFPDLSDYNLMNAREKLETERLAGCYETLPGDESEFFQYQEEYNKKLNNILNGVDTYWLSQPLRTVLNHKHSLSVDGGSESFRFGFDLQYTNQDGVMKDSYRDRYGASSYLQYNYKNISIRNYTSYYGTKSQESPYGNFSEYTEQLPYDVFKDENGNYLNTLRKWTVNGTGRVNPLYEPSLNNYDRGTQDEFINNLSVNWNILPSLTFKGQLSMTKTLSDNKKFYDPKSQRNADNAALYNPKSGTLYLSEGNGFSMDINATLAYNTSIGKHQINAVAGYNLIQDRERSNSSTYLNFPSGTLDSPNYAEKILTKPSYSDGTRRQVGVFLSANYTFDDIYLLDVSCRVDGSSAFGSDKPYAPFWSLGLGINLHKYNFLKRLPFIDEFKVRGSYGQTGKANFQPYEARTSYQVITDEWYKNGFGVTLKALGNKNLKWETTNTLDIGAELLLFDNLIYLKGSYYHKLTVDLINDVTIPSSSGFTTYRDNLGEVLNEGYELDLKVRLIQSQKMNLMFTANMGGNKNTIKKISESLKAYNELVNQRFNSVSKSDNTISTPFLQYQEGGSLNSIWGCKSLGINPADGSELFIRSDGLVFNDWTAANQMVLGNTEALGQGSFGFNFQYKWFSVFTNFMYEFGGQRYNQTLVDKVENANVYLNNVDKRVLEGRWQKEGDHAQYKSLRTGRTGVTLTRPTSRFVQDYNMLSWSSLEFSFDLPERYAQRLKMGMLRFTIGMGDLMNLSSVKQERGTTYPYARNMNFSMKASF